MPVVPDQLRARAVYYGDRMPPSYIALNAPHLVLASDQPFAGARSDATAASDVDRSRYSYLRHANEDDLDSVVKIVPLPVCLPGRLSQGAIAELRRLREAGVLCALRGGRRTDLAHPLRADARAKIKADCPSLVDLIGRVEAAITGGDLFLRAVKLDEARASTTQADADRTKTNLHFDAERSSLAEYGAPVYQFYANVARLPRQFRLLPIPLPDMLDRLRRERLLTSDEATTLPLEDILLRFRAAFSVPIETIVVESGQLALFDGRTFAHDAGKGVMRRLLAGAFVPSAEADFVLALDTVKTGYHEGYYDPSRSMLDDPGTDAWWKIMGESAAN